jgi:hypothetical protein
MSYFHYQLLEGLRRLAEHLDNLSEEDMAKLDADLRKYNHYAPQRYAAIERQLLQEEEKSDE